MSAYIFFERRFDNHHVTVVKGKRLQECCCILGWRPEVHGVGDALRQPVVALLGAVDPGQGKRQIRIDVDEGLRRLGEIPRCLLELDRHDAVETEAQPGAFGGGNGEELLQPLPGVGVIVHHALHLVAIRRHLRADPPQGLGRPLAPLRIGAPLFAGEAEKHTERDQEDFENGPAGRPPAPL